MIEPNEGEKNLVNSIAQSIGIEYPVRLSPELFQQLKPNEFLSGLGIRFSQRVSTVLSMVKANMVPKNRGPEETLPQGEKTIPLTLAQGPFIREEPVSILARLTDDGGVAEILLTAIPDKKPEDF
jgi:hypothetical protein